MRTAAIIKFQVTADRSTGLADAVVAAQMHLLVTLRHRRSTNTLSRQAPRPSMLMATPLSASTPVNAAPVNCEP